MQRWSTLSNRDREDAIVDYLLTLSVTSLCAVCKQRRGFRDGACAAFPDGIPDRFWVQDGDHTSTVPGDNGITFSLESGISWLPIQDKSANGQGIS